MGNSSAGVRVENYTTSSTIGGLTATPGQGYGNVISGNYANGVVLTGVGVVGNLVGGNLIGLDVNGNVLGNSNSGIVLTDTSNNSIGGSTVNGSARYRNIIAGNGSSGISISGEAAIANWIAGNYIGTDPTGLSARGNGNDAITVESGPKNNTIGGTTAEARNVIAAGGDSGIYFHGVDTTGNVVWGNYIGTDKTGLTALGNAHRGVTLEDTRFNTIGGSLPGQGNVISGNNGAGIDVPNTYSEAYGPGLPVSFNDGDTNPGRILSGFGTTPSSPADLSFELFTAYTSTDLWIGVHVTDNYIDTGDTTQPYFNDAVELYIGGGRNNATDYTSSNHAGSKEAFSLTADAAGHQFTTAGGAFTNADWSVSSKLVTGGYVLEFKIPLNLIDVQDGPGFTAAGPGSNLKFNMAVIDNDANVTAQQRYGILWSTDNFNGTGHMSQPYADGEPAWLVDLVLGSNTTVASSAPLTLNASYAANMYLNGAINTNSYANLIQGNLIGLKADGSAPLPNANSGIDISAGFNNTIGGTSAGAANIIGGNSGFGIYLHTSQATANSVLGNRIGISADGMSALATVEGVVIDGGSNNTIGGTALGAGNRIVVTTPGYAAVSISNTGATGNVLLGNTIGLNGAGTASLGTGNGVYIGSDHNTVGGTVDGARNVIVGAGGYSAIWLNTAMAFANLVAGNYVGTTANGTGAAFGGTGISIQGAHDNTIGGSTSAGAGNIVSGNSYDGLDIGSNASNNLIAGNYVGLGADGSALGNSGYGVRLDGGATYNTIGGSSADYRNVISANNPSGIFVDHVDGTLIQGNIIGLDPTGSFAIGNLNNGIEFIGSGPATIGGTAVGNTVSGNGSDGIYAENAQGVRLFGNLVGLNASGTSALGNGQYGVDLYTSSGSSGSATIGAGNVISGNAWDGIFTDQGESLVLQGSIVGLGKAGAYALSNGWNGVDINGQATIGGANAGERNIISGNTWDGIYVSESGTALIQGNYVGTDAGGNFAIGNSYGSTDGYDGIYVDGLVTIGGSNAGERNVISGAVAADGIGIGYTGVALIQGNYIGTDATGSYAIPNDYDGIYVSGTATIGGAGAGEGNLISGNGFDGIFLSAGYALVLGNTIGLGADGYTLLANGGNGIEVFSANNTIGGTLAGARNIISGNALAGMYFNGSASQGNLIAGNYIGTDTTGLVARPNQTNGVEIHGGAYGNTIGGSADGFGNLISGNAGSGILIADVDTHGNLIEGNFVGVDETGNARLANSLNGIVINGGAYGNTIGGIGSLGNLISGNAGDGILLAGAGTSGNVIQGNTIGTDKAGVNALPNGSDGIDIVDADHTTIGGDTYGQGNLISSNGADGVYVYQTSVSTTLGAGTTLLGNFIGTNRTGNAAVGNNGYGVNISAPDSRVGDTTTYGGNLISGNSLQLEFYGAVGGVVEGNIIGLNASKSAAILRTHRDGVTIRNSSGITIGGTASGARNVISGNGYNITLDPGSSNNLIAGNLIGTDGTGTVAIAGEEVGINVGGSSNTIGGTSAAWRNVIAGNSVAGIWLVGTTANVIQGNYIGVDVTGAQPLGNGDGIRSWGATELTIGGTSAGAGNVISGNTGSGIYVTSYNGMPVAATAVWGNMIGTNPAGTSKIANANNGILIDSVSGVTIGGANLAVAGLGRNVISGNTGAGVLITGLTGSAMGTFAIYGNYIGTDVTGTANLGNTGAGVYVSNSSGGFVGSKAYPAQGNVIAYNGSADSSGGVFLANSGSTVVETNSMFLNNGPGISNSALTNTPTIQSYSVASGKMTLSLTYHTTQAGTYWFSVYAVGVADADGHGEGKIYLGGFSKTLPANSDVTVSPDTPFTLLASVPAHAILTTTATAPTGGNLRGTSGFGANFGGDRAPVANPGSDRSGMEGTPISFDGSGSTDPDGDSLTYTWKFYSGATLIGTATGVKPFYTFTAAGNYTATLTVDDGYGLTNTSSPIHVTVQNSPPQFVVNTLSLSQQYTPGGRAVVSVGGVIAISQFTSSSAGSISLYDATSGALLKTFSAPSPVVGDRFGAALAVVGTNQLLVGSPGASGGNGAAYIYDIDPKSATFGSLKVALASTGGAFGTSVAAVGSLVVVGAPNYGNGAGEVVLFNPVNGAQTLAIADPNANAGNTTPHFGQSVAALGSQLIVGATTDGVGSSGGGAVYLFNTTTGQTLQTLLNPNPSYSDSPDLFGAAVAGVGTTGIIVGSPFEDVGGANSGAAYLFDAATGKLSVTFTPALTIGAQFGSSIAVSGTVALVGAPGSTVIGSGSKTGAGTAYLIDIDSTSATYGNSLGSVSDASATTNEHFGTSVGFTSDGRALVGSDNSGVSVYQRNVKLGIFAQAIAEGGATTLSGSFTDLGTTQTHTLTVNWGDGSANTVVNMAAGATVFNATLYPSLSHIYPQDAATAFPISVTVTDIAGGTDVASGSLNVRNVAPTFVTPNTDGQMDEGSTYSLSGTVVDPGTQDTHTVTIDWGDGSTVAVVNMAAGAAFPTQSHKYVDNQPGNAPYTIHIVVTDSAGASNSYDLHEIVRNVAPTIQNLALSASTINEGDTVTLTGGWTDPGTIDTHSVTVQWGDGTSDTIPAPPNLYDASVQTFSISHKYLNNPIGVINLPLVVSVADKDGGVGTTGTAGQPSAPALAIYDVAPTVSVTVDQSAAASDPNTLNVIATIIDPGFADIYNPSGFKWVFTGVDDQGVSHVIYDSTVNTNQVFGPTFSYPYPNDPGVTYVRFLVKLTVTDRDGKSGTDTASIRNFQVASNQPLVLSDSDFTTSGATVTSGVVLVTGSGSVDASNVNIPLVIKTTTTSGSLNVTGGQSNDLIIGDGSTQTLVGGAGNDTIISNHGDDMINVGTGDNTVVFIPGSSPTIIAPNDPTSVNTLDLSMVTNPDTVKGANAGVTLDLSKSGTASPMTQMVDSTNSVSLQGTFRQVVGTSFDDTLVGSGKNDTLDGGGGSNSITAGAGDTTVYGGTGGKNTIVAGHGNDLLFGGTNGGDSIVGASGNMTVSGGAGAPTVMAGGGNSTINASGGHNTIVSSGGNDLIFGASGGNDSIMAGTGNTTMSGGTGQTVTAGTGNTTVYGGSGGRNTVVAGGGNDLYFGSTGGGDSIIASTGNTTMAGGNRPSTLTSGGGNTTVYGGSGGHNTVVSGGGNDLYFGSTGGGDSIVAGSGNTTTSGANGNATMTSGGGNTTVYGSNGGRNTVVAAGGNDIYYGGSGGNDSIVSGTGNSTIRGSTGNTTMSGGTGHNTIVAGGANNTIISGGGNDLYFGSSGGHDSIVSGTGNTTVSGASGNSTVTASTGNATIQAGGGYNTIKAGGGNDLYFGSYVGHDSIVTGSGNSTVSSGTGTSTVTAATGNTSVYGGTGGYNTVVAGGGNDVYFGSTGGHDSVVAGSGNTTVSSGGGSSTVTAGTGNTSVYGGSGGHNTVVAGGGNDVYFGSTGGHDSVVAGSGNATTTGGTGNTTMTGATGNATVYGGGGSNTIVSAGGNSVIFGGTLGGNSITGGSSGNSTLVAGGSNDVFFGGFSGPGSVGGGSGNVSTIGGNGNTSVPGSTGSPSIAGGGGYNTIIGGGGNDVYFGSAGGHDSIVGGPANVTLSGTLGNSSLASGGGNVTIFAGGGYNTITAGAGNDLLFGSTGGHDSIVGGTGNVTTLGGVGNSSVTGSVGNTTVIGGSGGYNTIVGGSGNNIFFGGPGFDSITGGAGNTTTSGAGGHNSLVAGTGNSTLQAGNGTGDTLIGTVGTNTLLGGSGNDLFFAGAGTKQVSGGQGDDTVVGGGGNTQVDGGPGTNLFAVGFSGDGAENAVLTDSLLKLVDPSKGQTIVTFSLTNIQTAIVQGNNADNLIDASAFSGKADLLGLGGNDSLYGGSGDDSLDGGSGNDLLKGGLGQNTYYFRNTSQANETIDNPYDVNIPQTLTSHSGLDFFGLGAPVTVDLALSTPQVVSPGLLTITLVNPLGISDVFGTSFDDVILGNSRDNNLTGAAGQDLLVGRAGNDRLEGGLTQTVYLDFDTYAESPGMHNYTQAERDAITQGLAADYGAFSYVFTQTRPQSGDYTTITFNDPSLSGLEGGISDSIDWRNLVLNDSGRINVNGLFTILQNEEANNPAFDADKARVQLTITITAHELAHLAGLKHGDSYGPIGAGIYSGVDPSLYLGDSATVLPQGADETPFHILASGASVGTTLADAAGLNPNNTVGTTFFGEREDVKLAFDDHGQSVLEQAGFHSALDSSAQLVALNPLTVPNTELIGRDAGLNLNVHATDVIGQLSYINPDDPNTQVSPDVYAFHANAGDVLNAEVLSASLARFANTIDSTLALYYVDPVTKQVKLVPYYGGTAFNDDSFQGTDSILIDVTLPASDGGVYYLKVDSYNPPGGPHQDAGGYELFFYTFAVGDSSAGGDTMIGGSGSDTLVGNSSTDLIEYDPATDIQLFDPSRNNVYLNAPPQNLQITVKTPGPYVEGSPISLTGSFVEYDDADTNSVLWQVFASTDLKRTNPLFTSTLANPTYTPTGNGTFIVVYNVNDSGGNTSSVETTLNVLNAPPTVTAPADQSALQGASTTILLGSFSDLGLADGPWSVDVSWGDGTADSTFSTSSFSLGSLSHAFAMVGSRLVTVTVTDKGGMFGSSTFHVTVSASLVLKSLVAGSPTVRNTPESYADVTFNNAIDTTTLTAADFKLTRNGSLVSIAGPLSVTDMGGYTYRVSGFSSSNTGNGNYVLTLNAAGVSTLTGNAGVGVASASFTVDKKLLSSTVTVAATAPGIVFPITITGSDTDAKTHVTGLGLDFFDIYWAADGGAFTLYGTVPAGSPDASGQYSVTTNIVGASNHSYAFYIKAHDLGGNVESKVVVAQATTYVNDFTAPDTHVRSAVNNGTPTYLVSWAGKDNQHGSGLASVDLYVSIDQGQPVLFQTVTVSTGQKNGTATYNVNQDGRLHTYRFFSIGTDFRSNREAAPTGANDDVISTYKTASPPSLAFTSLVVNGGLTNRSYISTVDLGLTRTMTAAELAAAHVTLIKHNLAGTDAGTVISLDSSTLKAVDHAIEIEFGAAVLGGSNAVNNLYDGVYEIDLDLLGNGDVQKHYFYRLIGDTNNDYTVDQADIDAITAALPNPTTSPNQDVNGDGRVNSTDKSLATRYKGSTITFAKSLFK